jgi:uncharacterized membrane protein
LKMINETILPPGAIEYVLNTLRLLVGGVFGIYIIMTVVRIIAYRRLRKNLQELSSEVKAISKRLSRLEKNKNLYTSKR